MEVLWLITSLLKILGLFIIGVILVILFIICLFYYAKNYVSFVPRDYEDEIKTGGDLEKKYLSKGEKEIKYLEIKSDDEIIKNYEIYYPKELENNAKRYPLIIISNSTGLTGSKIKPLFKHLASWGFITVGNEDNNSWTGEKINKTIEYMFSLNDNKNSIFYNKIDIFNVGVTGHSQGGIGAINASNLYQKIKSIVVISCAEEGISQFFRMSYDIENIDVPIMLLAGAEKEIISEESLEKMYKKITTTKVMAIRKGVEHNEMIFASDGYVTAWFMFHLQNDMYSKGAFFGDNAEILKNELYKNQKSHFVN